MRGLDCFEKDKVYQEFFQSMFRHFAPISSRSKEEWRMNGFNMIGICRIRMIGWYGKIGWKMIGSMRQCVPKGK